MPGSDDPKTQNHWAPTTAPVADVEPPATRVRKPIGVWIMQAVCTLMLLIIVVSMFNTVGKWVDTSAGEMARFALMASMAIQILVFGMLTTAIVGAQRRSRAGQWLAALLVVCAVAMIYLNTRGVTPGSDTSAGAVAGRYSVDVLFLSLPALLIWFATFSRAARSWYARS
jgi:hypothetical protein